MINTSLIASILLIISLPITPLIDAKNIECQRRYFNQNDSCVCVCNEQICDTFESLKKTRPGIVQSYVTSRKGLRFHRKFLKFSRINPDEQGDDRFIKITIDRGRKYQRIIGFGGAFTDSAGLNLAKLTENLQRKLIENYFGPNGIEYNLGRIPIGGSDFSTRPYSYDDDNPNDDTLSNFSLQMEDFQFKIPYLQMAQNVSANKKLRYFASTWSPPAWMKTNNRLNHGGLLKGRPGEKYYKLFAKYIVKFLQEYERHNLTMWAITVVNEPASGYDPEYRWNCLGLNSTLERDFIRLDLGPELHENGYTKDRLALIIHDDQTPSMKQFTETIMADPNAAKYVSGIGFHWYHNDRFDYRDMDYLHSKFPNIFLLATEACEEWKNQPKKVHLGSWHLMNRYASDIINDLNHFATGWTDWNLALDMNGGPNWARNMVDAPIIINTESNEYYKQPSYYAMGHFSKFLVAESVRISNRIESNHIQTIDLTTFERPDDSIVMIVLNQNKMAIHIEVYDRNRGRFRANLNAESITTFLWY